MTGRDPPLHVLVTGATRGIGAAILQALPPGRARAVGHGRHATGPGWRAADLSEPGAGDLLWDAALDALDGRIDVLVNNAGIYEGVDPHAPAAEWQAAWARTLQVNLQAAADLSRRALLHFGERPPDRRGERGRIVHVASRAAHRGDGPMHWHYAAAKAGMVAMAKSMARAYAAQGIGCFTVAPGFTATDMAAGALAGEGAAALVAEIPLGRVARAEEVAEAVRWLVLDAPLAMTGAVLDLNGASHLR
jgi:NAD(P)-dependent dehydrogenase (short-subunit alcohol dehydrogenase family)